VKVTVLVADAAQELGGKIYALGVGWSVIPTPTPPHALIILIDVDWTETNRRFNLRAELVDSDMQPVMVQTGVGEQPVQIEGEVEVGRPAGLPPGSSIRVPFVASFGPLVLVAGSRYEWRVTINGEREEDWSEGFHVRPQ
jgi:hypothetical protein